MVKKLFNVKFTMASFSLGTCVHSPIPTMRELVKMQYVTVLLLSLVTRFLDVSLSRKLPQIFCLYFLLVFISEEENVSVPLNDFTLCNLYKNLKPTLIVS